MNMTMSMSEVDYNYRPNNSSDPRGLSSSQGASSHTLNPMGQYQQQHQQQAPPHTYADFGTGFRTHTLPVADQRDEELGGGGVAVGRGSGRAEKRFSGGGSAAAKS